MSESAAALLVQTDLQSLVQFALGLVLAGLAGGVIAGLLGVGGGIVVVPVLYHVFSGLGVDDSIRMPLAVGTSLATIIPASIRSNTSHRKKGAVDMMLLKSWAPALIAGVLGGSVVARLIGGKGLTLVFAVLALIVAAYMAFGRADWRLGEALPEGPAKLGLAGGIGLFSTLMGIGGGTFGVPIMTLFGMPVHRAVGTSSGLGLLIGIPGTIGFILSGWGALHLPPFSLGYVNLLGFLLITPATWLAVPWGVELAHRLSRSALTRAFALFLALTSLRMFIGLMS
ncbi:MAG TPA: sulfite exporter TauE/SafE family protein [Steroidobacteraceae bacterium]|nr:sulfite exporter TauE/SafE family protein [Steroidobacteraceae bacterium]